MSRIIISTISGRLITSHGILSYSWLVCGNSHMLVVCVDSDSLLGRQTVFGLFVVSPGGHSCL